MSKRLAGISFLAVLGFSVVLIGNFVEHAAPGGNLAINEVFVDFGADALIITGENFDPDSPEDLFVSLGALGDISDICNPDDAQTITCDFQQSAGGLLPVDGDYLLTIDVVGGQKPVSYDLTIGAVGPAGPVGPAGADGEPAATEIYVRTSAPLVLGTASQTQNSNCDSGDTMTGGGYRLQNASGEPSTETSVVVASRPSDEFFGLGWAVTAFTAATTSLVNLYVTVICTDIDFGNSIPTLPS